MLRLGCCADGRGVRWVPCRPRPSPTEKSHVAVGAHGSIAIRGTVPRPAWLMLPTLPLQTRDASPGVRQNASCSRPRCRLRQAGGLRVPGRAAGPLRYQAPQQRGAGEIGSLWRRLVGRPPKKPIIWYDDFVSLIGWLTALVSDTTMISSSMERCLGPGSLRWEMSARVASVDTRVGRVQGG